jgi:hypothetical protein
MERFSKAFTRDDFVFLSLKQAAYNMEQKQLRPGSVASGYRCGSVRTLLNGIGKFDEEGACMSGFKYYFHLVLGKCASTFIQNHILSHATGFRLFNKVNSVYGDIPLHENRTLVEEIKMCDRPAIVSEDDYAMGFVSPLFPDYFSTLRYIREEFGEVKILLLFRRQDDFAETFYTHLIASGAVVDMDDHLIFDRDEGERTPLQNFANSSYDWLRMVEAAEEVFGSDNVVAFPWELIKKSMDDFLGAIYDYLGVPPFEHPVVKENPSLTEASYAFAKKINPLFRRPLYSDRGLIPHAPFYNVFRPKRDQSVLYRVLTSLSGRVRANFLANTLIRPFFPAKKAKPFSQETKERILSLYATRNRELQKHCVQDLGELGYY